MSNYLRVLIFKYHIGEDSIKLNVFAEDSRERRTPSNP